MKTQTVQARAIAMRRRREPSPWLPWLVLATLLAAIGSASAQPSSSPSANQPAPAPLPPGAKPDVPGGRSTNGVVHPPPTAGDSGMHLPAPAVTTPGHSGVITPPGPQSGVVPK